MESVRLHEAQQLLACEIAACEPEAVAPIVRTAVERGWVQHNANAARNFNRALLEQRRNKEEDIRRLCERYYGEFLGCIQQLLQMRGAMQRLKQATQEIHEDLVEHSAKAIHVIEDLHKQQRRRMNVEAAQAVISDCKEIALLMVKAQQQIKENDTYSALETVEQLQAQDVSSHGAYSCVPKPFLKHLQKWLPAITDQLIQTAREDLSMWFTEIREQTLSIGTAAIHRSCLQLATAVGSGPRNFLSPLAARYQALHVRHALQPLHLQRWAASADLEAMLPRGVIEAGEQASIDDHLAALDQLADSFGPVHRSVHAYARLGRLQELQRFYTDVRSVQAQVGSMISLDLHKVLNEKQFEAAVHTLACKASGFFLTECILRQTVELPEGVITWSDLQELWERCSSEMGEFFTRNMSHLTTSKSATTPLTAIRVKETLLALHTLMCDDVVGLRNGNILDLLTVNYVNFRKLLVQSIEGLCRTIIETSQSQPLQIVTPEQFQSTIAAFRLERVPASQDQSDLLDRMQAIGGRDDEILLPHTFPFSEIVPKTMRMLHRLMMHFIVYTSQLTLRTQATDLVQLLNTAVEQMSACIADAAKGMDEGTPLSRISQLSIDAMCLGQAFKHLRPTLDEIFAYHSWTDLSPKELERAMETAQNAFETASVRARDLIFEHITDKIEDLLGSMCFVPAEPNQPRTQPHSYCDDIIGYLQVTFMCLTHLPLAVREGVHFASCARVANGILGFLTDPEENSGVKKINVYALLGFRKDVQALQQFADSCGVNHLSQCFLELSQVLDAALNSELPQMVLANDMQAVKNLYPTLNTSKLAMLMDKIVAVSVFARSHAQNFTSGTALLAMDKKTAHKIANKLREFEG